MNRGIAGWKRRLLAALLFLSPCPAIPLSFAVAQTRFWRPEDRTLFTDFSYVTAVAATQAVVYAATPGALVVYDRGSGRLRETVGAMDGYPRGGATTMVADPNDDTAWLGAAAGWYMYRPWGHDWESGPLPGQALSVVLDADNPASGAWYSTTAGWQQVNRGGFPGMGGVPPAHRIGPLSAADLRRAAPAFATVQLRITRDAELRTYPITSAAQAPADNTIYVATAGNGVFKVDPVGYFTEQLPPGLLAPGAGGLALSSNGVCAGTDDRFATSLQLAGSLGRRGVTCVSDDGDIATYEAPPGVAAAGPLVKSVAVGPHDVVWAASEAGLLRFTHSGGEPARVTAANGLPSDDARAVAADSGAGGVWVGTGIGLAFVTDADRPQVAAATRFGAAIGALATMRDTLWIGSALGLVMLPRGASAPVPVTGQVALRDPVVGIAVRGDTVVVATPTRVLWRTTGAWSDVGGGHGTPNVGGYVGVAIDERGVWAAGTSGIAFCVPRAGTWVTYAAPGDLPPDIHSIVAGSRYVWVGTRYGLVRFDRRVLER